MSAGPRYHEVDWTGDAVRRFWDYQGANEAADHAFFSRKFARRIVGLAERHVRLQGLQVDVGCGPGFLCEELLRRGHRVGGVDAAKRNVDRATQRLGGQPRFVGAALADGGGLPLAEGRVGGAFLIEVLEHLPEPARPGLLGELHRVVRPGGTLVLTTPNEEDLDAQKLACPECGCVFHRVQHQASLDAGLLRALLAEHGFEPVFVGAVNFRHFPDLALGRVVAAAARRFPALGAPPKLPHLVAVARRAAPPA